MINQHKKDIVEAMYELWQSYKDNSEDLHCQDWNGELIDDFHTITLFVRFENAEEADKILKVTLENEQERGVDK